MEEGTIHAAPGTYGPISTGNKPLHVIGTEGAAATVIDGGGTNRCVTVGGSYEWNALYTTNTLLEGFTLRNGMAYSDEVGYYGGGVKVLIDGGNNNDFISNDGANSTLLGGADDDSIDNYGLRSVIDGGAGNDIINNRNKNSYMRIL